MKKLTIISLIFLSVTLSAQSNHSEKAFSLPQRNFERTNLVFQEKDSIPPLSVLQIIAEGVGGVTAGFGLGALIYKKIESNNGYSEGPYLLAYWGFAVGEIFGSAIAVNVIGSLGTTRGNFFSTLFGSAFGMILGVGVGSLVKDKSPVILFPTIAAVFIFNRDREYEPESVSETSMIHVQENKIKIATPKIFLTKIDDISNRLRYNVELLRVNF